MLPAELPAHVHRKRAKGRIYLYFDTGQVDPKGKRIFVRLPDYGTVEFHRDYAKLKANRERRENPEPGGELLVPALCEAYRKSWRTRKKPLAKSTRQTYEIYLAVIERELDTFPADQVAPRDVLALHQKLYDTPGAANQCVRVFSAMYAWASKPAVGLAPSNPARGIEFYEEGEYEPWPDELLEEALAADDEFVRLAVNLLYYGGQRIGDTAAMPWRKITADYGYMSVKQEKTGEELEIRVHEALRTVLRSRERTLGTIIAKADGTRYSKGQIRVRLQGWAAERGHDVVPHGLRKNAVNGLLEAGCSTAQVSSITGQSLQIVEHYAKKRNRKRLSDGAVLLWEQKRPVKTIENRGK